jgi:hypothetical protein
MQLETKKKSKKNVKKNFYAIVEKILVYAIKYDILNQKNIKNLFLVKILFYNI